MAAPILELTPAEVLEVIYTDDNPLLVYGIKVKVLDGITVTDPESTTVITAVPLNFSYIRVPIVGEIVIIINAPSSYTNGLRRSMTAYYLDIVSLNLNIHNNSLPGAAKINVSTNATSGDDANYNESAAGNTNEPAVAKPDPNFSENITLELVLFLPIQLLNL